LLRSLSRGLEGNWALSLLATGRAQEADRAILDAAARAENGGITFQSAFLRASAVSSALAQGDVATADARWAELVPDEERRLSEKEKGIEIVRLLLLRARVSLAHHHTVEALSSLANTATLIGLRHQPTNPDTRELETLEGSALLEQQRYAEAAQHAQAAVELARSSAIDPNSSAWIGEALILRAHAEARASPTVAAATAQEAMSHLVDKLDPTHPLIAEARALSSTSASAHD
jgi:hypothetical protein